MLLAVSVPYRQIELTGYTLLPPHWVCSDSGRSSPRTTDPPHPRCHTGNLNTHKVDTRTHECHVNKYVRAGSQLMHTHPGSRSSCAPAGCSIHPYRWSRFHCRRLAYSGTGPFPVRHKKHVIVVRMKPRDLSYRTPSHSTGSGSSPAHTRRLHSESLECGTHSLQEEADTHTHVLLHFFYSEDFM